MACDLRFVMGAVVPVSAENIPPKHRQNISDTFRADLDGMPAAGIARTRMPPSRQGRSGPMKRVCALAAVLMLGIAGCGGDESSSGGQAAGGSEGGGTIRVALGDIESVETLALFIA